MSAWDSEQYLKFAKERKQPCIDLINRLSNTYKTILDLGCGPGNSTENLKNKYMNAEIIGIDIDDNMLDKARAAHKDIRFIKGTVPESLDVFENKFDLIFSNACIHWIQNQKDLIYKVYDKLTDNGVFAVQIPITQKSMFYRNLYSLIDKRWDKLKNIDNFHNLDEKGYYNELIKKFKEVTIWATDYYHIVDSKKAIIEWYKGSGLRPYLNALNDEEKELFLNDLKTAIDKNYSTLDDGKIFLIMPRLFFIEKK